MHETVSGKALNRAMEIARRLSYAGMGRLRQVSRPQRDRDAAVTGTGTRTKSVLEIVHQRTSGRPDAVL